jgi:DNA-binding GntR family transcriptional regulator
MLVPMEQLSTIGLDASLAEAGVPLSDLAHRALAEGIIRGVLPPGTRIAEAQLAQRFGINRAPLREAVRRLEENGLVQRRPHASLHVASLSPQRIIEMFVLREALEGMAARLAAARATEAEIAELRGIVEEQARDVAVTVMGGGDRDWRFHAAVTRVSGNAQIHALLESDLYRLLRNFRHSDRIRVGRGGRAVEEHRRIVSAIEDRDAELAELLMRRHIAAARAILHATLIGPEGTNP